MDTPKNKKASKGLEEPGISWENTESDKLESSEPIKLSSLLEEEPAMSSSPTPKPRTRRTKPTVEGINSPQVTTQEVIMPARPVLTEEEKELISEPQTSKKSAPRLMPQPIAARAAKPEHKVGRWIITGVILLALVGAGYVYYIWNIERHILPVPGYSSPQPQTSLVTTTPATTSLDVLRTDAASSSSSTQVTIPSATSTSASSLKQLTVASSPTGYVNVRSLPSTSGKQLTQVHPGEVYPYTNTKSGWYEIVLPDGSTGWIIGQYVTLK